MVSAVAAMAVVRMPNSPQRGSTFGFNRVGHFHQRHTLRRLGLRSFRFLLTGKAFRACHVLLKYQNRARHLAQFVAAILAGDWCVEFACAQ